jgi:hypothetical protein
MIRVATSKIKCRKCKHECQNGQLQEFCNSENTGERAALHLERWARVPKRITETDKFHECVVRVTVHNLYAQERTDPETAKLAVASKESTHLEEVVQASEDRRTIPISNTMNSIWEDVKQWVENKNTAH